MDNVEKVHSKILRLPDVTERVGRKRSSIYFMVAKGEFPKSIKLGKRSVGWLESEIDNWIDQQIEKSRQEQGGGECVKS